MKPKFAITCIILLIVANLSVVYFRSCKEGFKVADDDDEEDDPPKKKGKKKEIKKDPCAKLLLDLKKAHKKMISATSYEDTNELIPNYQKAYKVASDAKCEIPDPEESKSSGLSSGSSFGFGK